MLKDIVRAIVQEIRDRNQEDQIQGFQQ